MPTKNYPAITPYSVGRDKYEDYTTLRTPHGEYAVCFIPEGLSARKVHQGPLVPGPWAYSFGLPTVIVASPDGRTPGPTVEVADGDIINLYYYQFRVGVSRRDVTLTMLDAG